MQLFAKHLFLIALILFTVGCANPATELDRIDGDVSASPSDNGESDGDEELSGDSDGDSDSDSDGDSDSDAESDLDDDSDESSEEGNSTANDDENGDSEPEEETDNSQNGETDDNDDSNVEDDEDSDSDAVDDDVDEDDDEGQNNGDQDDETDTDTEVDNSTDEDTAPDTDEDEESEIDGNCPHTCVSGFGDCRNGDFHFDLTCSNPNQICCELQDNSDADTDEEPTDEEPTDEEPTDEEPTDEEPTDEETDPDTEDNDDTSVDTDNIGTIDQCTVSIEGATGNEPDGLIPVCCAPTSDEKVFIDEVFALLNQHRADNGRDPLTYDTELEAAMQGHCMHMSMHDFFDHVAPTSEPSSIYEPWGRAELCGTSANGENIAMGQNSPNEVMQGWISSSGHNQNMLSPNFTRVGIGYYSTGQWQSYWGQIFGN